MDISVEMSHQQNEMYQMAGNKIFAPLFVAGYGSGKSFVLVHNVVRDVLLFNGCKIGVYAPTHDLLSLNLVPAIEELLDARGIKHTHNKSKHIMHLAGDRQIIFRSMDNPSRIVAYEVYRSHVDEADLMTTAKKGDEAWNRIIARNRQKHMAAPNKKHPDHFNMVSAYSTPESYKFTYQRWKKNPGEGYKYVVAPTRSNWNLDASFIDNLNDTYTPQQQKAYLEGIWTNISTGSVYSYYDRDKHDTKRIIKPGDMLHIGQDFNYGGSCGAVYVNENDSLYMVDEFAAQDTEQIVETARDRYDGHHCIFYPDATGNKNSTNASASDITMLKTGGFRVRAKSINPRITDRINAVQRLLYNNRFFINKGKCPKSAEAMEEHAFSETTGLPEKFTTPASVDDRNDGAGYCPAFLYPIKKNKLSQTQFTGL
jgi:hypothetical protein